MTKNLKTVAGLVLSTFALNVPLARAEEKVSVAKPLFVYGLAAGADLASTQFAIGHGATEANPVVQGSGNRAALKLAEMVGLTLLDTTIQKKNPKAARWLRWTVIVAYGGVAAWNLHNGTRR